MSTGKVLFDRIGRNHYVPPLDVPNVENADDVAERVFTYARGHLGSRFYDVAVVGDVVTIEGGRFGNGVIVPDGAA